ncbi:MULTISPECIES: type VII secretion protein EccC [Mycobacterium]|uniref:type VII secretion protein EccC n=1 Tax=Mycobacterium TaxID=1763 RepID=UPI0002B617C7|nr:MULTISPECIES: type VII secretion protein EccC [Mycobacterium]AFV14853.1 ftsK/SpoIIIE family protein [Mycobacterium intracellulare subsp. yongonense 05-1390]BDE17011.1 ESX-5 secretion system protein EccC5 [Mycobacterium sp. 20KCMC460]GLC23256.1 ESX-5 secretion system protein EccC5 [Mycobacterium kiyosense]GLD01238.1 ESX-5 secretion system protein EccC5 [Mycobacterium kiyosense]GLD08930.1 ESX-5 secretion system protein EccC5 [Mycobacterium kiyosense]
MKIGFARKQTAQAPPFKPETLDLPTPLKVPPPQSKPLWSVALIIGLLALFGGMMWISFASGARSFTGAGSFFPLLMVGGLVAMLFGGRGGSQEMSRSKLDALRARFCMVMDELRGTTSELADRLDQNHRWYHPAPGTLEAAVGSMRMWERKPNGSDTWFGVARVGVGMTDLMESNAAVFNEPQDAPTDIELEPVTGKVLQEFMQYQTVAYGTPKLVSLMVEPGYELRGPRERVLGLMRAILCELVFFHGPDHLRLVVVTSDAAEWDWVKWLPHAGDPKLIDGAGPVRMVYGSVAEFLDAQTDAMSLSTRGDFRSRLGASKDPIDPLPHTVVVCDTEAGWERLGSSEGVAGLTFFDVRGLGRVPACRDARRRVLYIGENAVISAVPRDPMTWDPQGNDPQFFAYADQMSRDEAETFAERMARFRLAEAYEAIEVDSGKQVMARDILSYYGIEDAANIDFDKLWGPRSDINSLQRLKVPLGNRMDNNELFFVDIKEDSEGGQGPHGVMAGTTGSGKTTMLRAFIESLMLGHPPQNLQFMLADLKGGSGVRPFAGVPHVSQIITDLEEDQGLMTRFIDALDGEIARRKALCDVPGADDVGVYNKIRADQLAAGAAEVLPPLPVLVVVIDEFAELFKLMGQEIQDSLYQIARQGRAYWIHLLMASQQIETRAEKLLENVGYRMALQTNTTQSATAIGVPNAVNLKGSGQCYFLQGSPANGTLTKFQGEFLWREYRKPGTEDLDDAPQVSAASVSYFAPQLFSTDFTPLPPPDELDESPAVDGEVADVDEATDAGDSEDAEERNALMRPQVGRIIIDQLRRIDFEPYRLWKPPLDAPWSIEKLVNTYLGRPWDSDYARTPNLVFPVGLVDRPFKHDQHPLTIDVSGPGGNVVIVGAQGSGKTTALQDLICAAAMTHTPEQVQFYCLAFSSAALSSVSGLPHVGGVSMSLDSDGVRRTVAEIAALLASRKRSFEATGVMSMEVFRRRKAGREPGAVPEDGYGDVFLVIDNYAAMVSEYEALVEDKVNRIIKEGPTFGIHVVAAVTKNTDLQVTVRGNFGSRVELRLADFNEATLVAKARLATAVPARPGRGMIGQNYERTGVDPVGLHTLMARPALESTAAEVFDSRSVAEAVSRQAVGFNPARKVRRLPGRVSPAELAAAAATDDRTPTSIVWALDETERPVFLASQHLIIAGQPKCGRTTACATLMREIRRVYAPGADGATGPGLEETADRPAAQVWLIDPRRQLLNVLDKSYVQRFASTPDSVKQRMGELAAVLAPRLPSDDLSVDDIGRRHWQGPEIFLIIDDSERLPVGFDSPLGVIERFVQAGDDVGLHIIYTRQFAAFMAGLGADPVFRMLKQAREPELIMDSDPDQGFVKGKWKGHWMPKGRGFLLNTAESGESGIYVQVADAGLG